MKILFLTLSILLIGLISKVDAQVDLTVVNVMPASICNGGSMPMTIEIHNFGGGVALGGQAQVSYTEGGSAWNVQTLPAPVNGGGTTTFTFTAWVDVSTCGPNTVTAVVSWPGDMDQSNDTIQFVIENVCLMNAVSNLGDTVCSVPNQVLTVDAFSNAFPKVLDWEISNNGGSTWTSQGTTSSSYTYANPIIGSLARAIFDGQGVCPNDTVVMVLLPQPNFVFQPGGASQLTVCDNRPKAQVIVTHGNMMNDNIMYSTNGTGNFGNAFDDTTNYFFSPGDYSNNNLWIYAVTLMPSECPFIDSLKINWAVAPNLTFTGDTTPCLGDTVTLTAAGAFSITWYPNSGTGTGITTNPWIFPASVDDTIALYGIASNTCTDTIHIVLEVLDPPLVTTMIDSTVCPGDVIQLITSATNATAYLWVPALGLSSTTVQSPFVTVQDDIIYTVFATGANGCTSYDQVSLSYFAGVNLDFVPDTTICPGSTIILNANAMGSDSVVWNPNLWINNVNAPSPAVTPPQTIMYRVEVYDANCTFTDSIFVFVDGPNGNAIISDSVFCLAVDLTATVTGGSSYVWMIDGVFQTNGPTMIYQPTDVDSILIECEITSVNGCVYIISKNVLQGNDLECGGKINNAFSPNGDGINDVWIINGLDGTTTPNHVEVFTRYGDVLVDFDDYDNVNVVWNGNNSSGKPMPSGVYFYVIEVGDAKVSGWVNISK